MRLAGDRAGQFRVRQRAGAHHVVEVQLVTDRDRGQRHAPGALLASVPGRQRVPHGQDQAVGRRPVCGQPDQRHVR